MEDINSQLSEGPSTVMPFGTLAGFAFPKRAAERLWVGGLGVVAGLAVVLLAIVLASQKAALERAQATGWARHSREVLLEAERALSALQGAEGAVRGFVINGKPVYLEPYETGRRALGASLDRLAAMTQDNAGQQDRIAALRQVASARLARLADTIDEVRSNGRVADTRFTGGGQGRALMEQARSILAALETEEERLLQARSDAAEVARRRDQLFTALLGGFGCVGVLGMLATMMIAVRADARLKLAGERAACDRLLRTLVEHAPGPIAMFDTEMRYLATNRRYLEDYQLEATGGTDGLTGRSHYELFPDTPDSLRAVHRRVLAGETYAAEAEQRRRADGTVDCVRWEMVPWRLPDATIGGAILFSETVTARCDAARRLALPAVLDPWRSALRAGGPNGITGSLGEAGRLLQSFLPHLPAVRPADRRRPRWPAAGTAASAAAAREEAVLTQAAAALRESEARLRVIFDTVPVGIVIAAAPSGRIVAGNHLAERLFRHPGAAADAVPWAEPEALYPDGRSVPPDEQPLAPALAGEAHAEAEVQYRYADGAQCWVRLIATPLQTGGRITGAVMAILDIDRKMRALQALSEANAAREAAQAQLLQSEKLNALGRLAGGIAHDFNNVMQAILGTARRISRHAQDPEKVRQLVSAVEGATFRGASVTRRLLAFARQDALRAEAVDVAVLLDGLQEVLSHTLSAAIAVRLDVAPGLLPVLADPGQLEAVLINLATNARDAMPGGGTLTLSAGGESVPAEGHPGSHRAGLAPGGYVRFAVADSGTGMDATILSHVLEPFFTTKPLGQGTGLGLPMARGFAEQSGGALQIASTAGAGTTVTFWLPVAPVPDTLVPDTPVPAAPVPATSVADTPGAVACPAEPEARRRLAARETARILMVDDEALIRDVLAEALGECGFEVLTAASGEAALALLDADERVDLLVSDLSMPGMDGVTLIRMAQIGRPGLPAILLTGFAGDTTALAVTGAMSGSFSLVRKPVTGAHLGERVSALLDAMAPA